MMEIQLLVQKLYSRNLKIFEGVSATKSVCVRFKLLSIILVSIILYFKIKFPTGLDDTPTIFHYVNTSAKYTHTLPGLNLKREYTSPFIVNITITRGKTNT